MYKRIAIVYFILLLAFVNSEIQETSTVSKDSEEIQPNSDIETASVQAETKASSQEQNNENQKVPQQTTEVTESGKTDTVINNHDEEHDDNHSDETTQSTVSTIVTAENTPVDSETTIPADDLDSNTEEETTTLSYQLFDELTTMKIPELTVDDKLLTEFKLNDSTILDKKKPFFHNAVDEIVKVVESNLIDVVPTTQPEFSPTENLPLDNNKTEERLDRLSDQIRAIIRHYQNYGEVTVPNADVPDPMDVPDVKKNFAGTPATFTNMKMYGMSNFTISQINTDLNKMQVYVLVMMKRLVIIGNYSLKSFWLRKNGPFNVTLLDVETEGAAELKKTENGTLQASDSALDMTFRDAVVDFKNIGMVGQILQTVLATAAPALFEAIKPVVLKEINTRIREDLNNKLSTIGNRLAITGSRPPYDAAVEEGRLYIKENGYDPLRIRDYSGRINIFTINITEFVLEGLSRFQRVGEVVLAMDEGNIQIGSHVAVLNLVGRCKWGLGIDRNFKRKGYTNFTIDHLQVRALVNQSLDVKKRPTLDKLDLNVGKVNVNMEGSGKFDIIIEILINTLPELIRHIFIDAIEIPLRFKVQNLLNRIEPEVVLEKALPELDNLGL